MDRDLEKSQTFENLKKAFFEEVALISRYRYFSTIADYEGLTNHSNLFKEFADGGQDNTHGCLDFLRTIHDPSSQIPIGNTSKNLESLLQTEIGQFSETYPEMAKIAREEGFPDVASWFDTLEKLKRIHVQKLQRVQYGK